MTLDSVRENGDIDVTDRDHDIEIINEAIEEAHRKSVSGRVYDAKNERVRQGWLRTVGYLIGQKRQLLKDKELDELREEVEKLKANGQVSTDG